MRRVWVALLGMVLAAGASASDVYKDSGGYVVMWQPGSIPMQIKMPATAGALMDGSTSYATPILGAMQVWNEQIGVVQLVGQQVAGTDYATGNGVNEIVMDDTADDEEFGDNTLAITLSYRIGNTRTESDIIFNSAHTWNSYRGEYRSNPKDIRRVALHELGHVLGLLHPDEAEPRQNVSAIMNSLVGDLESLTSDDISGARYLYGARGAAPSNDHFANASVLNFSGGTAQVTGATIGGTVQSGEPRHDSEDPSHSIWWRWTASNNTTVTISTMGSNFDTVLGVYTGNAVNALTTVASNDDEERGVVRTSKLAFNPVAGTNYYIAVDGWDASYGQVTLTLTTATGGTSGAPPVITTQPSSLNASVGGIAVFSVNATNTPTSYQWYFNGAAISGATTATYTVTSVTQAHAGNYSVIVSNSAGSVTSSSATLSVFAPAVSTQVVTSGHEVTLVAPLTEGSYQWQVSTNGGVTWTNLTDNSTYSGTITPYLTIKSATSEQNNYRYRYVINPMGGSSTGAPITLSVAAALIPFPVAIAADGTGSLYVADSSTHVVQKISATNQVTTLAGTSGVTGSIDGTGAAARFNQPSGVSVASGGSLVVSDTANALIRQISPEGAVTTLAGSATVRGNDDATGSAATFRMPIGIARHSSGTVYLADANNHTIRAMTSANVVTTFAGSAGNSGSADANGAAARFNFPTGVAVDNTGNVYVADTTNNLIRKITPDGTVTTLAGVVGVSGWEDGNDALFNQPQGIAVDSSGNLYVADTGNSTIRKITPAGMVTTVAGLPTIGGLMDGTGSNAWFNQPRDLTVDTSGNLYVADTGNAAIRKITPAGVVTTLALTAGSNNSGGSSGGNSGGGTTPPPSPGGSSGGGGGGGATSLWFVLAVSAGAVLRLRQRQRRA